MQKFYQIIFNKYCNSKNFNLKPARDYFKTNF